MNGGIKTGFSISALAMMLAACGGGAATGTADASTGGLAQGIESAPVQAWPQDGGMQADPRMTADMRAAQPLPQPQRPPMPPPLDTRLGQQVQIMDMNSFGKPVVAGTVQIPAGWQSGGGITWNTGTPCFSNQMQVNWSAIGPDSLTAVALLPGFNWQVQGTQNPENPCPVAPFRGARDFLAAHVQKLRPGMRIVEYRERPDLVRQIAAAGQQGIRYDAGQLIVGYPQDGVEMEESLLAVVTFTSNGGGTMGSVGTVNSVRGPKGRVDMGLAGRISATMQPDAQYMAAVRQRAQQNIGQWAGARSQAINDWHNRQMAVINARGNADRHAIRMRTNSEVASIYNSIATNTSQTNDGMHATTMSGVREVNNYAGVDGTTVENSIHNGTRVFQDTGNPNNAYSTDQPYAQPPSGYVELEPMR